MSLNRERISNRGTRPVPDESMGPTVFDRESLISDPLHGYIAFTAVREPGEVAEQSLVDHPWVQRLRRIHQLQSAWWVYPSAEHTRFQHVLGAMHLAGRAARHLYPSLCEACKLEPVPSAAYVESLLRLAALLHDVGHGPYGHFFDDHFLDHYGLTHEDLGQRIILTDLAELIRGIRSNPHGTLATHESLQPEQVAFLIKRPGLFVPISTPLSQGGEGKRTAETTDEQPRWLRLLRGLFSGVYTVDNMDFVLRDGYMAGYGTRTFDLERLLHYSFFTPDGLTLHVKGLAALAHFIEIRGELFRNLYFHRTVRAIDLTLAEIFRPTLERILPGNPLEHLERYRALTEWSLLVDVERWAHESDPELSRLGKEWQAILGRRLRWKMACERTIRFEQGQSELASIFTDPELVEKRVRAQLPASLRQLPFRADVARHYHRPMSPAALRQNFVYEPATGQVRPLADHEHFARLPISFSLCRLYALDHAYDSDLTHALDRLLQAGGDDRTNM
jgi:HD superfamily phosphohydrolase